MAWHAKFDDLVGNSKSKRYQQWCSPNFVALGRTGNTAGATGTSRKPLSKRMHFDDVELAIIDDRAMPRLLEVAIKGEEFNKVEIHGTEFIGTEERTYVIVELEQAKISAFQLGAADNNPSTDDMTLTLTFERSKIRFIERAPLL